jgi:hypothetical protein
MTLLEILSRRAGKGRGIDSIVPMREKDGEGSGKDQVDA